MGAFDESQMEHLACHWANRLLRPQGLGKIVRSGLFVAGDRGIGKTTFLIHHLIPLLRKQGACVIHVDMDQQGNIDPWALLEDGIHNALSPLKSSKDSIPSCDNSRIDLSCTTLADWVDDWIQKKGADVVLVLDEVQQVIRSKEGVSMMLALKAARDRVNLVPWSKGSFLVLGVGSDRDSVKRLVTDGRQAFYGGIFEEFPLTFFPSAM